MTDTSGQSADPSDEAPTIRKVGDDRVALTFQIEDLLSALHKIHPANCMGCMGCMASDPGSWR